MAKAKKKKVTDGSDKYAKFTSAELVKLLTDKMELIAGDNPSGNNIVEASLINGAIKATHRMFICDDGYMINDTGIDDEEGEYDVIEWVDKIYPDANWYIDKADYGWLLDESEYVVFRIEDGIPYGDDMFLPKYIGEETAIKAVLQMVEGEYGDCEEALADCEEDLRKRWYCSVNDGETDYYIRELKRAVLR